MWETWPTFSLCARRRACDSLNAFTRAALSACGRAESKFLSVINLLIGVAMAARKRCPVRPTGRGKRLFRCGTLAMVLASGLADLKADVIAWPIGIGAIPRFDPAYGQLREVTLDCASTVGSRDLTIDNPSTETVSFTASVESQLTVFVPGTGLYGSGILRGSLQDVMWPQSSRFFLVPLTSCSFSTATSSAEDLAFFTGTDPVGVVVARDAGPVSISPSYLQFTTSSNPGFALGAGYIAYDYVPVPEPSTFALVGLGAAALMIACRRR